MSKRNSTENYSHSKRRKWNCSQCGWRLWRAHEIISKRKPTLFVHYIYICICINISNSIEFLVRNNKTSLFSWCYFSFVVVIVAFFRLCCLTLFSLVFCFCFRSSSFCFLTIFRRFSISTFILVHFMLYKFYSLSLPARWKFIVVYGLLVVSNAVFFISFHFIVWLFHF